MHAFTIIGTDAQREATHYKNRVLDLVEVYTKKQPGSPLVLRFILPLIELVVTSGTDERQLADKSTGILRSRFGKAKEVPLTVDTEQVTEILREIHSRARKALTADMLNTLSQCSLFATKCLIHAQKEQHVADLYKESLRDFITRKASRLQTSFFLDLIRRHPAVGWDIRTELLGLADKAVNGYRQTQIFVLLQTQISQMHAFVSVRSIDPYGKTHILYRRIELTRLRRSSRLCGLCCKRPSRMLARVTT